MEKPLKILRWWKTVPLGIGGVAYDVIPMQEITSDHGFFDRIAEAVKKTECDFVLLERTEFVADYRNG